ncbi:aquaporin [Pseudovibrio sp. WM33]|uniref:aquaporin n=1 Tax=Pseudovibrio sp. WM33 TaxID=1735585 RepID=UPI0007AED48C|nr:aquaporin [Pseudovibrio sp. WM33]KZL24784.1 Aquaporin Z [Pseudovibrio sp. WM33]
MLGKLGAEFVGTFALVSAVCGGALVSYAPVEWYGGSGLLGVAFAVGLSVVCMAYAFGNVSGAHVNPSVTIGLWAVKRFPTSDVVPYIIVQVIGGTAAAFVFWIILAHGPSDPPGFASNGYGEHSNGGFSEIAVGITEITVTAMFLIVIIGATSQKAPAALAPLAIGLMLACMHIIAFPISGASLKPARSTATAVINGGWALEQLWLFWLAPIVGALIGAAVCWIIGTCGREETD